MNRLQKKILTIALALSNIMLTCVVAGTATFAWFKAAQAQTSVQETDHPFQIGSDSGVSLTYEVLAYDDDVKEGVSYQGSADAFKLRDYDRYISYNHKYENAIMRVATNFSSFTEDKEINIEITCDQPYFQASPNQSLVTNYTSNVIQFKTSVVSYITSASSDPVHLNEYIIDEVDEQGHLASAARSYETATTYFRSVKVADSFVSSYNATANKLHFTLTCVPYLPTDQLGSDHTITSAIIYIECSYNEEAVQYYIDHNNNSGTSLTGDITNIQFRNVDSVAGGYVKTTSTPTGGWDGEYLAVYESNMENQDGTALAYDGLATAAQVAEKGNFFKVGVKSNVISANSVIHHKDIDVDAMQSGYSLQTEGANYIAQDTRSGQETSIRSYGETPTESNISSGGVISNTAGTRNLAMNGGTGDARIGYFAPGGTSYRGISLYKYNGSYVAPVLTSITFASTKTNYTVGESFNVNTDLSVTAHYQTGATKPNVQSQCEITGYDLSQSGTQTVTVYYTENNITVTNSYTITVSSTPYIELSDYELTISGTGNTKTITATPHNFGSEMLYEWSSSNAGVVAISSGGETATVTISSVSAGSSVISCYATDGEHSATATCHVYVVTTSQIWKLVEDVSDLSNGDEVIITADTAELALSTTQNTNNRGSATISKNTIDKTISFSDEAGVQVFTLASGTASGSFAFYDADKNGYIYAAGGTSNNHMKTQSSIDANASFTLTVSEGKLTAVANGASTHNVIRFNNQYDLFSCYESTSTNQKDINIYRHETGDPLVGLSYSGTVVDQYSGRPFNASGLTVEATYLSGRTEDVTNHVVWNSGNTMQMGDTMIPVSYTEGNKTKVTYVVDITVIQSQLQSLQITGTPDKTVYLAGTNFDKSGLTVKAIYNYAQEGVDITNDSGLKFYAKNTQSETLPAETTTVTACYTNSESQTASADVNATLTVVNKTLDSITVSGGTTTYTVDGTFNFNSTVTGNYNTDYPSITTHEEISSGYTVTLEGYTTQQTAGHVFTETDASNSPLTVTVSYPGVANATFEITVNSTPVYGEYSGAITEGDYVIVGAGTSNALTNSISSSRFTNTNVTISDNKITNPSVNVIWHISQSGGYWNLYNAAYNGGNGGYAGSTGSKNQGAMLSSITNNAKWTITGTSSSNYAFENYARSIAQSDPLNKYLRNNDANGWATYQSSTGNGPRLFKLGYTPSTVTSVTLNTTSISLNYGGSPSTQTLIATVSGTGSYSTDVTWSTSSSSVATVSNGVVTAVGGGDATITVASVQDPTKTATCSVHVTTKSVISSLTPHNNEVEAGASSYVTAVVTTGWDNKTKANISWSVTAGATVLQTYNPSGSDNGKFEFTAKSSVATDTTVTIKADLGNGSILSVNVTIKAAGSPTETEVTYTFTSNSWADSTSSWTSGKAGNQFTANQGIQVTTGTSGANATSKSTFTGVSKIVVNYCTNAKNGAGTINVRVGSGTSKSFTVTKSGGTTRRNTSDFTFSPSETGAINISVNCTTNSIYIWSITITYVS